MVRLVRGRGVFGETVRACRRRLGLTQEEVAARTGVSVRTVRGIETGRIERPRAGTVRLLADVFDLGAAERDSFLGLALEDRGAPGGERRRPAPAQLPADIPDFTGRAENLRLLTERLATAPGAAAVITGTAGIGKTALAVHWAHQVRDRFPDGQLYADLRGYDPDQPVAATDVLARFLTALGLAGPEVPLDADERAARYRTEVADRRMLVVLDNASTVDQVRPLLPGTPSCAVVVTSRDSLGGLVVVHGARRLDLDLLPEPDAVTLLRRLVGPAVDAEPDAAAELVHQCARLPLALRIAAELVAARSGASLRALVAELADQQRRLTLLDAGDDQRAAVRSVFSWSIRHLPTDAAETFRLLGLHPGPDVDVHAVAALTDAGLDRAHGTLALLARAHLVHLVRPGRYGMHDLLRAYALELASAGVAAEDRRAAVERLLDYYLSTAGAAMSSLYPAEAHRRPPVPAARTPAPPVAEPDAARAWLDAERPCLTAVVAHAATHGWAERSVRLSMTLFRYAAGGHPLFGLAIHRHARAAAHATDDLSGEAETVNSLGGTHIQLGLYGLAAEYFAEAGELFRRAGNRVGEARTLTNLGHVEERLGRYEAALRHLEQALALFREVGDRAGETRTLGGVGNVEQRLRRDGPADRHLRQALALACGTADRGSEASILHILGAMATRLGRHDEAGEHLCRALALYRRLGDRAGEGWTLDCQGTLHTRRGDPDVAAEHHREALALFRETGERDGEAWARNGLGEADHLAGRHREALTHHTAALDIAVDIGVRDQQARAHTGLGHAHRALDEQADARRHHDRAVALLGDLGVPEVDGLGRSPA
ncbi:ATP-binding protein [Actinophytocola xanthii]|uniref:HTH cro/C1-type domain-containing protein n=1 Tax=Actinophytocola xanthii TaxID=1912961 RepID=A0A1Q8CL87_9PSEU|nr:tetratricopeptide repeat protein [Actinophytocola xanthii]OLF15118.1 hypothetical protein BU204_23935 [Actinophytocola xanthii]